MTVKELLDEAIGLAKSLAPLVPELSAGAAIGEKVLSIIHDLSDHAEPEQQPEMQHARSVLAEAVVAKARAEAAALRGEVEESEE